VRRPNLRVVTGALVHRVLFDGTRAVGIEYSHNGATERVDVAGEVILAAGAIGSPHILQLSGVGDPKHLERAGIGVHHDLRGVGRNMQDHYLARVSCEIQGAPSLNQQSRGLGLAGQVLRYLATGSGILTYAASLVAASVKVLPESATPDVQCLFAHGSYAPGASRQLDTLPGMTCGMWQMRPLSRGYVEARSPRPQEQPNINPRYFSDETDCRVAVGGLRWIRKLFAAPALAKYVVSETVPGKDAQSDDELLHYVKQTGGSVPATCTCKMGSRHMAVVDDRLRVHGLNGCGYRRVGDAGGDFHQHQCTDHHDRREGRGDAARGCAHQGRMTGCCLAGSSPTTALVLAMRPNPGEEPEPSLYRSAR
jgi:choline dehydrogenase